MKPMKILAIVLIISGVIALIFGIYQFVQFQQSLAGKAASLGNQISRAVGGTSKVAGGYVQPIILTVCGIAAAAAGFVLIKKS